MIVCLGEACSVAARNSESSQTFPYRRTLIFHTITNEDMPMRIPLRIFVNPWIVQMRFCEGRTDHASLDDMLFSTEEFMKAHPITASEFQRSTGCASIKESAEMFVQFAYTWDVPFDSPNCGLVRSVMYDNASKVPASKRRAWTTFLELYPPVQLPKTSLSIEDALFRCHQDLGVSWFSPLPSHRECKRLGQLPRVRKQMEALLRSHSSAWKGWFASDLETLIPLVVDRVVMVMERCEKNGAEHNADILEVVREFRAATSLHLALPNQLPDADTNMEKVFHDELDAYLVANSPEWFFARTAPRYAVRKFRKKIVDKFFDSDTRCIIMPDPSRPYLTTCEAVIALRDCPTHSFGEREHFGVRLPAMEGVGRWVMRMAERTVPNLQVALALAQASMRLQVLNIRSHMLFIRANMRPFRNTRSRARKALRE